MSENHVLITNTKGQSGRRSVILCVDDDQVVLRSLHIQLGRIFGKENSIEIAETGEEALEIVNELISSGGILPVVIADQQLPGLSGNELLKIIHQKSEKTLKIMLTGQADAAAVGDAVNHARLYRYIAKPWETADLIMTVSEALRSYFQNLTIEDQNHRLQEYSEHLEEKVRQRTSEIQKAHKHIKDSIVYACMIQQALLPPSGLLSTVFSDHFILFRPVDIVSGDFYWFKKVENFIMVAAVDCTGHGVPGAFLSMLGISFLNEIVISRNERKPDIILNRLREMIKLALSQTGKDGETRDGMDMALCVIDESNDLLEYSGAYNPLYIFRKGRMTELNADRMPVGIYPGEEKPFSLKSLKLEKDDRFYIFSDGYVSQFGGTESKKFKTMRFKEVLAEIHHHPLKLQHEILTRTLEQWQGELGQTDDILVMGFRY